jgi:hypothetical protein
MSFNDYRQNPTSFDRRPPPALPVHDGYATPSPTPTVKPSQMEASPDKLVEKGIVSNN